LSAARVSIYTSDYDHIDSAVERAIESHAPPVAGRTVLVKPNVLGATPPERHSTTHPTLVSAVVRALQRRGAGRIMVGDNSGMMGYGANTAAARASGIMDAAGSAWVNLGASPAATAVKSEFAERLAFSREVIEADVLINLPKMKTHVATTISGAVKNTYGHLVGGEKTRLHGLAIGPENFARAVVDVYQVRPPDLTIMDAVVAMEGEGPSAGRPHPVGRVIASASAVALDAVMATMMGLEPRNVPMLRIAAERGLGPADLGAIELDGDLPVLANFRMPRMSMGRGAMIARIAGWIFVSRPAVVKSACTHCGECVKACPVDAILMTEGGPTIDQSRCVACFCCHEMCRSRAIRLSRRMRWIQGLRR